MKIKSNKVVYFLWSIVLISRILISMENPIGISPLWIYYISSSALILWLIAIRKIKNNKKYNYRNAFWLIAFIIYVILFGKILENDQLKELIDFNFGAMFIFYLIVFLMADYLDSNKKKIEFVKNSFWILAITTIIISLLNWHMVLSINELVNNFFKGYTRERYAFGFYHPNAVANIALCIILLSILLMVENGKRKIYIIIDIIMCYLILVSSSRTSVCALILFFVLYMYSNLKQKIFNKHWKVLINTVLIIILGLLLLISNNNIAESLFVVSNRSYNFIYNIPILIKSGRFLIGLGFIGSGEFYQLHVYNTFFVDNYFLYVLMSTGLIGLVFIVSFIIWLCYRLLKGKNNSMKKVVAIILGVNIFSSLGETCFMYPSFISCFVYTIIYLTYACESIGSNKNNTIRKIKKDIY